ncbi:helix-turn-helix domain-containing protein [Micromonospora sp. CPCC 206060]|uniref:helix-turn-helix domain-containing protein n=1 Tax=Micromonospora sp. CPCC 206060 TaxID=3122406 RepID=UPI002FF1857D
MFGQLVSSHRRRLGFTQEELAARAGVGVRSIRDIERRRIVRPRQGTVRSLADAFGLSGAARERFCESAMALVGADGSQPGARTLMPPGAGTPAASGLAPTGAAPATLPMDIPAFVGRDRELERLDQLLATSRRQPVKVLISAVWGMAGVGKTALVVHWAHRVAADFPDGRLYLNLRGFDPGGSMAASTAGIRTLLDALGVSADRIPTTVEAQVGLYRSMLSGRRVLVVLDNAAHAEQVRPLLPASAGCVAVVTSRNELASLVAAEGAHPITLDVPSTGDARHLLARRLGQERVAGEPRAVGQIIDRCARLPLALAVVAARAATRPDLPLHVLAGQLANGAGALDVCSDMDPAVDVRTAFSRSYRMLDVDTARLFRLLGRHAGPDITVSAAARLVGAPLERARRWLAELTRSHLLVEHASGRYTFHDLMRVYAAELANAVDRTGEGAGPAGAV